MELCAAINDSGLPGWTCEVRVDCMLGGPFHSIVGPVGDYEGAQKLAAFIRSRQWEQLR